MRINLQPMMHTEIILELLAEIGLPVHERPQPTPETCSTTDHSLVLIPAP
ncbi:MAG: hypothetical protein R3F19_27785 [Verrucomicrobiales bacterium]